MEKTTLWHSLCSTICKGCFQALDNIEKANPWNTHSSHSDTPVKSLLERVKDLPVLHSVAAGNNELFFNLILTLWHQIRYGGWVQKEGASYIASIYAVNEYDPHDIYYYSGQDAVWKAVRERAGNDQIDFDTAVDIFTEFYTAEGRLSMGSEPTTTPKLAQIS